MREMTAREWVDAAVERASAGGALPEAVVQRLRDRLAGTFCDKPQTSRALGQLAGELLEAMSQGAEEGLGSGPASGGGAG